MSPRLRRSVECSDLLLSTLSLTELIEYEPADLTVSVGAGLTLDALGGHTRPEGQWLPVDPPGLSSATLGGMVATGLGGSLVPAFGRPRDLALGATLVTGDGRILKVGGKVVKNVAGFDLVKLVAGSSGTLGVITDVTVRLFPEPALDRTLVLRRSRLEELLAPLAELVAAPLVPAALDLMEGEREGALVLVRLIGSVQSVQAEVVSLRALVPDLEEMEEGEAAAVTRHCRELEMGAELSLRAAVVPSRIKEGLRALRDFERVVLVDDRRDRKVAVHGGRGIIRWAGPLTPSGVTPALQALREAIAALGGRLSVGEGANELPRMRGSSGGSARGEVVLARGLRAEFDPEEVFSAVAWHDEHE